MAESMHRYAPKPLCFDCGLRGSTLRLLSGYFHEPCEGVREPHLPGRAAADADECWAGDHDGETLSAACGHIEAVEAVKEGAYIRDLTGGVAPPLKRVTGVSYGEG